MRRFLLAILLIIIIPTETFASVVFESLLPNPAGEDTLGEYIELRNIGCTAIDIGNYTLSDASGKSYSIPSSTSLSSHESRKFFYSETKIALNNTGNESVSLKDPYGVLLESYEYSGTQKDNIVIMISFTDDDCREAPIEDISGSGTDIGAPSSSSENSGSGIIPSEQVSSGSISNSGTTLSGEILSSTGINEENSNTGTGYGEEVFITGSIYSGSGITETGSSLTETGILSSSGITENPPLSSSGNLNQEVFIETGLLLPASMVYADTDGNKKIDTLEILYPYSLTGKVNTDTIFLYSNTGGLSLSRMNTLTGYILHASLSGNTLILNLAEGDHEKESLKINNTISSDLRLKSSGDLGFRSLGGKNPEPFLLTASFENYKKVFPKFSLNTTGSSDIGSSALILSGSNDSFLTSQSGNTEVIFPPIALSPQSPSNITFSGDTLVCTSSDCRMNITLEPIFSSGFVVKNYICSFGTGEELLIADSDCNPNTFSLSSSGIFIVKIASKQSPEVFIEKIYPIEWQVPMISQKNGANISSIPIISDSGKPIAKIEIDGKWKEYYEQIGDYELNCYTMTCSVNFSAEKSLDPEGSTIRWLWIYGPNDISTSRDPGTKKYEIGDHELILRVIDAAGNMDEIRYKIHVLGSKPKAIKQPQDHKVEKLKKIEKSIASSIIKKKPKKLKMTFFSPPEIILQGRTGKILSPFLYLCTYKKKPLCSTNFSLSGTLRGYDYRWSIDGQVIYQGKNPPAWKLSPGKHVGSIAIYYKSGSTALHTLEFSVQVNSESKKIKKARTKKVATKIKKQKIPIMIEEVNAGNNEIPEETSPYEHLGFTLFLSGVFLGFFLHRRKMV